MYKISELVLRYTSRSKEDKLNIVKKLGYKNLNKGFRRLDTLIQTGQCPDSLRNKLPTNYFVRTQQKLALRGGG
jgi:hypothetical protein